MREIKFRGKTKTVKGTIWAYGYLYKVKSFFDKEYQYFIKDEHLQDVIVDENTLGQYTGLHDKNGKEIYEGDIVKVTYKNEIEIFEVRYDEENTCFRMHQENEKFLDFTIEEVDLYEVIGNIYENKELLED